ncbi:caspase-8-like [Sinocyclocheilus rhinocerous]|uniref:caspase-8-like n=1 Tax=Sinocyclocheilus rhinocerous TaxID=307959 RepID=UPI0007B84A50|nr:PREDICTED: caspase-8-like [Sinocyclocheilus rhinocerous]
MQTVLEFQRVLLKVQASLTVDEVQDLVFLCSDLLSLKDLSTVTSAGQLFSLLENRDLLSWEDPSLLLELLRILKRNSLIRSLTSEDVMPTNGTTYSQQISPYRQLLYELSESICEQDLKNIKFLLLKTLPRKKLEKDTTLLQLFLEMEKEDLLDGNNLDVLQKIIGDINPSLEKRIIQYKMESCETGGMVIAQEIGDITPALYSPAPPSLLTSRTSVDTMEEQVDRLSLTEGAAAFLSGDQSQHSVIENESLNMSVTENPEIQQYEMKGDKRGVCLIINNCDFKDCGLRNRDGTDIDKKSLEVVFQWLGFEVLTEQNCDRHQILQVLRDLADRDHTSTDCVVCCVLSHGQIKGIVGVDGQIVTYRELIETLSPSQCPSLFKKPKLFFIQACRGTDDQPAAFPQIFPDDEVMPVSDAAVPRDSIPEMADYLLAMSTVPHYVSYREKDNGTWFIQSLCHNLKLLVPRGVDLLSILTKVNSDVSKKTDKSGLKKQMPQPEFTLTKRVAFPPPKTRPPLP